MSENTVIIKGRIRNKHDTEENWNKATNFAPLLGETIVYDPDATHPYPRYKTGIWDGESTKTAEMLIMNLPFANQPDIITEEDLANLFTSKAAKSAINYTSFNLHLIDASTETLTVASIVYAPGVTTWGDLIENYPGYFVATSVEWDKHTGKPYVRFAASYYNNDYVIKRVTAVNPEDPVAVPCITSDFVDPASLRTTYVCHDKTTCAICASYK